MGRVVHRASATKLAKLLREGPKILGCTDDMDDNWEHRIIVERRHTAEPGTPYPLFLGGKRRCPPEDCGSVLGYHDFLDTISASDNGKGSRKKREAPTWYGRPYDPDNIDEEKVRSALAQIARTSRPRKAQTVKS